MTNFRDGVTPGFRFSGQDGVSLVKWIHEELNNVQRILNVDEVCSDRQRWSERLMLNILFNEDAKEEDVLYDMLDDCLILMNTGPDYIDRGIDAALRYLSGKMIGTKFLTFTIARNIVFLGEYSPTDEHGKDREHSSQYYYTCVSVIACSILEYLKLIESGRTPDREFQSMLIEYNDMEAYNEE